MAKKEIDLDFDGIPEPVKELIDVEAGKVQDFISGKWVDITTEEVEAVQVFARRLVEDYCYGKEEIQTHPQFRVRKRPSDERKEYPVDIAVFKSRSRSETDLFMIVECKQPNKESGIRQLKIYMDLSPAVVGIWFNGKGHAYIRKVQKIDGTIDYVPLPNIPLKGQRIEDIGLFERKDLKPTRNLKALFKDIRNHLSQKAVGIARDEVIAQEVMNILFCKIYDEINTAPNEVVTFRSGVNESPNDVGNRIKNLFKKVKDEYIDIFDKGDRVDLDDTSINYIVGELQNYCITKAERDVLGDSFEVFIGYALKGAQGQFFTPRNVVRLAVNILDPSEDNSIIDPACGSGGFLVVAIEHIWNKVQAEGKDRGFNKQWIESKQRKVANENIRGIDKDSFLAKVTKAYMAIIGDGRGGIFCENSLDPIKKWRNKTKEKITLNNFDMLLTNPPFGSKIPVSEREILQNFDLGYKWQKKEKGRIWKKTNRLKEKQPPQILFIERCIELLKPGGKMVIVLPDGVLGGSRVGYIPYYILENARVLALIDCPRETFQPFVPTKTHLVFLEKKTEEEKKSSKEYEIFMGIANQVGHDSKGRPLFKDEEGEKLPYDDFPIISERHKAFNMGKLKKKNYSQLGYVVRSKWLENNLVARRHLPKYVDVFESLEKFQRKGQVDLMTIGQIKKELFTGANIGAEEYLEFSEYRYIMTDCVTKFGVNPASMKFITKKAYESNINKAVKENDIIVNRTGNPGVAIIVEKDIEGVMSCGFVFVLRLKKKYDPYYVSAFFNSEYGRLQTERCSFGSMLDHITKDDLENIIIPFPKDDKVMERIIEQHRNASKNLMKGRIGISNVYSSLGEILLWSK